MLQSKTSRDRFLNNFRFFKCHFQIIEKLQFRQLKKFHIRILQLILVNDDYNENKCSNLKNIGQNVRLITLSLYDVYSLIYILLLYWKSIV